MNLYLLVQDQVSVVQSLSYVFCSGFGPIHVPACHDHPSTSSCQVQSSFLADTSVASGDDDRLNITIEFNSFLKYILCDAMVKEQFFVSKNTRSVHEVMLSGPVELAHHSLSVHSDIALALSAPHVLSKSIKAGESEPHRGCIHHPIICRHSARDKVAVTL